MIDKISGTVVAHTNEELIIAVGDIDIVVFAAGVVAQPGTRISLYIDWVWNAEAGPQLYGFHSRADRSLFGLIRNCQGIGAKGALGLIATCGVSELAHAIVEKNSAILCKAPGVGRKRAELIIAQLHERIAERLSDFSVSTGAAYRQIQTALSGLGYAQLEIQRALSEITPEGIISFELGLKQALRALIPR
jgi:holliday junction DNA helicase RuvA